MAIAFAVPEEVHGLDEYRGLTGWLFVKINLELRMEYPNNLIVLLFKKGPRCTAPDVSLPGQPRAASASLASLVSWSVGNTSSLRRAVCPRGQGGFW